MALILLAACTAPGADPTTSSAPTTGGTLTTLAPATSASTSNPSTSTATTSPPLDLGQPRVWFGPTMGSTDFLELFSAPDSWSESRDKVDVFQFYSLNLFTDPCDICGDVSLGSLADVDAFRLLTEWGVAIAIEVGAVYEGGCRGATNFGRDAGVVISSIQRRGGTVRIIAMDEPLIHGGDKPVAGSCGYTPEEAAAETAAFVAAAHAAHPDILIGDIEPYPHYSIAELQEWIVALEDNGVQPAFIHLDVDLERVRVDGHDITADLVALKQFVEERGIVFGVIFTSNWTQAGSDQGYFESTMQWVETVDAAIGRPTHVIFQSWQGPAASGHHEVPINLPENDPGVYSHTRLMLEGLAILGD